MTKISTEDVLGRISAWIDEARACGDSDPTAATLATVSPEGEPTTRTVLVERCRPDGLVFLTAMTNLKAQHLSERPFAGLHFWWPGQRRQLRITGRATPADRTDVEALWALWPRQRQLTSTVARQGTPLNNLDELRARVTAAAQRLSDVDLPCPADYGGFVVQPTMVEFWAEESDGLALRLSYERVDGSWLHRQLVP